MPSLLGGRYGRTLYGRTRYGIIGRLPPPITSVVPFSEDIGTASAALEDVGMTVPAAFADIAGYPSAMVDNGTTAAKLEDFSMV